VDNKPPKVFHSKSRYVIPTDEEEEYLVLGLKETQIRHIKVLVLQCVCWKEYILENILLLYLSCSLYDSGISCSDM